MNILLTTAIIIAATAQPAQSQPVSFDLEAKAIVHECLPNDRPDTVCVNVQGQSFAFYSNYHYPVGSDVTVGFRVIHDGDDNLIIQDIFDAD